MNIGDSFVLNDDSEYIVAGSIETNENNFFLIVNDNDLADIKYVAENAEGNLDVITEPVMISKLLPIFDKQLKDWVLKNKQAN